jgi:hypothetical protein
MYKIIYHNSLIKIMQNYHKRPILTVKETYPHNENSILNNKRYQYLVSKIYDNVFTLYNVF